MRAEQPRLDLITGAALAGAVALSVLRPRHVSRLAAAPVAPRGSDLVRSVIERVRAGVAPARPLRALPLTSLIARYSPRQRLSRRRHLTRSASRRLNGSAALLAFSVLADSAIEHYRGSFENRAMYTPLAVASLALGASLYGMADARPNRHIVRDGIYAVAAVTGVVGLGFHLYNILKRVGRLSWHNLFYAAPVGAPFALTLSGLLGRVAERVRDSQAWQLPTLLGRSAGRLLAAITAFGLAGTVGEAGLLHFRGAYHNPAMMLPVSVPPVAAGLLGAAALRPHQLPNGLARWWLRLTALLGIAGVGFHAFGVSRNMAGWRNWSQNVLNGPPLPAPPSFTGLALAGLTALSLIDEEDDV